MKTNFCLGDPRVWSRLYTIAMRRQTQGWAKGFTEQMPKLWEVLRDGSKPQSSAGEAEAYGGTALGHWSSYNEHQADNKVKRANLNQLGSSELAGKKYRCQGQLLKSDLLGLLQWWLGKPCWGPPEKGRPGPHTYPRPWRSPFKGKWLMVLYDEPSVDCIIHIAGTVQPWLEQGRNSFSNTPNPTCWFVFLHRTWHMRLLDSSGRLCHKHRHNSACEHK